jgi:tRNA threonylcarbamoyladenosine biosynthesis protein TsaB
MIIAIETSTPVCSVALGENGRCIIEKRIEGRSVHSEYTFTYLQEFRDRYQLSPENIECVLFSVGPGSYTGLRIGAAAIKGFLFQRKIPLYTFPTLLSFAVPLINDTPKEVHSVIDARREHLYHQKITVKAGGDLEIGEAAVEQLSDIEKELKESSYIVGTGWERLKTKKLKSENRFGTDMVSAKNLIEAWYNPRLKSRFKKEDLSSFEPNYLTLSQINNSSARPTE